MAGSSIDPRLVQQRQQSFGIIADAVEETVGFSALEGPQPTSMEEENSTKLGASRWWQKNQGTTGRGCGCPGDHPSLFEKWWWHSAFDLRLPKP